MDRKFTPGPWRFEPTKPSDVFNIGYIFCPGGGFVATVHHPIAPVSYSLSESRANAHLIEAAPDLLEALDYLLEQTVDMDLKYGIALTHGEVDARSKALAAIAKATGKDQ